MSSNLFFIKKKIKLNLIFKTYQIKKNFIIEDIKPLNVAKKNDLSFFDSVKYRVQAENTKAGACITTQKLEKFLPKNTEKIIVKNVLYELAAALTKIYPKVIHFFLLDFQYHKNLLYQLHQSLFVKLH